ncbi:MAG TPA: nickel-binding protein [Nevskiaceae bacterium]|nr:nickel-binding protein [Nevskiaceae bacterium]
MPLYIDVHELKGVKAEDVAKAHKLDMAVQDRHGVNYLKYWVNESCGKVFCLADAPDEESARLVHMEAHGLAPGRVIQVEPDVAEGFMGGGSINPDGAAVLPNGGGLDTAIRTIVFTDIVDSTATIEEIGDDAVVEFIKVHDRIVREALVALGGREIKHTGDGIMASFISAVSAVKCAQRIQRELAADPSQLAHALRVRIGAAAGEPVEHQGDFFGTTVNLAARLCSHAQPEQVLVSTAVVELCVGKGLRFHDLGEAALKGFGQPVRVHAVAA